MLTCSAPATREQHQTLSSIDFANGGDIRGAICATEAFLALANEDTKVMTGHGTLANKSDIVEYNTMLKTARERVEKLFKEGKSEAEVVEARPLKDLDAKWAANDEAAINFLKRWSTTLLRDRDGGTVARRRPAPAQRSGGRGCEPARAPRKSFRGGGAAMLP